MVISVVTTIIVLAIMFFEFYFYYKKCENCLLKIIFSLLSLSFLIPIVIYVVDKENIPTYLGLSINVNCQNWLSFLANYSAGIMSAIIGAIVLVLVTKWQLDKNNGDSIERDKENLRIQNMPLIKYEISSENFIEKTDINHFIETKYCRKEKTIYNLFVSLKNIGLNSVKRIIIDFESTIISKKDRILGKNTIVSVEKNEIIEIYRIFTLKNNEEYDITLNIYYEDVLQNWYHQVIDINYNATDIYKNSFPIGEIKYKVYEEEKIDFKNIPEI